MKQGTMENELGQVVPAITINNLTGSEHTQDLKLEIPDHCVGAAECQNMPKTLQPALSHFSTSEIF